MRFVNLFGAAIVGVGALTACQEHVATPAVTSIAAPASTGNGIETADARPAAYSDDLEVLPLPTERWPLFEAGDTNALEIVVDAPLAEAYRAYFAGEGEAALSALDASDSGSPLKAFHLSAQRMRTLIMMGRAAEAEAMTDVTAALERTALGTDVNALALRAEARLWLYDLDGAEEDALAVAKALKGWVLPSSYGGAPTNMAEIVLLTTAQLRSYTVLAGLNILRGDAAAALPWAEGAERGYNTVHRVADHPLYGIYLKPYPESFYGRAFNLLFRAAARALSAEDYEAGAADFRAARAYFGAIGYRAGEVSVAALEAWTLYQLDQDRDTALQIAEEAVRLAVDSGFPDFVWRVSALRGEMLIDEGRMADAEVAFRRADASVDLATGALSTDRAKRRFGIGKETIAYRLARFDIAAEDWDRLFTDLERARARAFVDMLADRSVAPGRAAAQVSAIRELDREIRRARVKALAPRGDAADQAVLDAMLERRRRAVAALRAVDPDLAAVHGAVTVTLDEVRSQLGPRDTLAYAVPAREEDPVSLLIVTRRDVRLYKTDLTAGALRSQIIRFREAIQLDRSERQRTIAKHLSGRLGFAEWRPEGTLYVVPSGDFFFLPWGALPEVGPTVVLPTGAWLTRSTASVLGDHVGLIGDPAFGGDFPQLPGARAEAMALQSILGTRALIGEAATLSALRDTAREGARILHIASHGFFDGEAPLRSAVVLSDGRNAAPLTAAAIYANPPRADLVVLSACETGMGEAVAGDDFLGLARGFYLGGARAVMNSLWPVNDEGTRHFMETFHLAAKDGDLAGAWLTAVEDSKIRGFPPSVHAAFVLGGAAR
jgi:hypothetical protein